MKKCTTVILLVSVIGLLGANGDGCQGSKPTSDEIQREQQEQLLKEGSAQTGMPAIKNFRERKLLKDILELRDQDGLVTFTYLENLAPAVVPGKTAMGGKLTFFGETIGYGIPYATQYTNPSKIEYVSRRDQSGFTYEVIPQADPNGLYSPSSAEGTWVLMKDPGSAKVQPLYVEPRIVVSPFKLPAD